MYIFKSYVEYLKKSLDISQKKMTQGEMFQIILNLESHQSPSYIMPKNNFKKLKTGHFH